MRPVSTVFLLVGAAVRALPQGAPAPPVRTDSVVVIAGPEYRVGAVHGFFLGQNYRDLWTMPIKVPVLDLHTFAGGLHAEKKGGGMQTESLRLIAKDGDEYVFRTVHKLPHLPPGVKGSFARSIFADEISALHPAAAVVASRLLDATGVLHATPTLVVMPRDSLLGDYLTEFAGRLGTIEQYPGKPGKAEKADRAEKAEKAEKTDKADKPDKVDKPEKPGWDDKQAKGEKGEKGEKAEKSDKDEKAPGFAGAVEIVDSDSLRTLLNRDPREQVDGRALLTARLMDLFLNDVDRHPGQWKWARMQPGHASPWEPIPRDRDQAFISYRGALLSLARVGAPNLVAFDGSISIPGLTYNSLEMDRRLLGGLERPVWDSISNWLTRRLTDAVIDSAVAVMPVEYRASAPAFASTLRLRREHLRAAANTFYLLLASIADVHATDAADRLTVTRVADGKVEVRLEAGKEPPYFLRRFDARETREIRIYLHGGGDTSRVIGDVRSSIPVKVIGGNGPNWLTDSSVVDGKSNQARLIDNGIVEGVTYGKDTLFDRLPWIEGHGEKVPPPPDRGTKLQPEFGLTSHRGLGLTPHVGANRYEYGFRDVPYSSVVGLDLQYAFGLPGYRVQLQGDKRWETTPLHIEATALVSQFEVLGYHGLGNATTDSSPGFFDVRQRQWQFRPAVALALGHETDLSLGPVFQYTVTDSASNRFISNTRPYGFGRFSETGLRLGLHHEAFDNPKGPQRRILFDLTGTVYPAMGDVTSTFEKIDAHAGVLWLLPVATHPGLVVRAGATKLYGTFPYFESAFIGGNHTLRRMDPQRFAGDASIYANAELRVPLMDFAVMVPLSAGIIGTTEAGRVYVDGSSPGGWHTATGGGIWIGRANQTFIVSCTLTNEPGKKGAHCQTGLSF